MGDARTVPITLSPTRPRTTVSAKITSILIIKPRPVPHVELTKSPTTLRTAANASILSL